VSDRKTWSPFDALLPIYEARKDELAGFGLVLTGAPILGVDLDKCRSREGTAAWARDMIREALREGCYVEISPSGTGYHIVAAHPGPGGPTDTRKDYLRDPAFPWGAIEVYLRSSGRYLTITGHEVRTESDL